MRGWLTLSVSQSSYGGLPIFDGRTRAKANFERVADHVASAYERPNLCAVFCDLCQFLGSGVVIS